MELTLNIVCENEKYLPIYANNTDACLDLKAKVTTETKKINILPNTTVILGTGIKVNIPINNVMLIFPRSSTGIKLNCSLANGTAIIDSGYRDEIMLALYNFGNKTITIEDGQRLAQFIIIPRPYITLNVVKDDDNFRKGDRGGGIGSTGVK